MTSESGAGYSMNVRGIKKKGWLVKNKSHYNRRQKQVKKKHNMQTVF